MSSLNFFIKPLNTELQVRTLVAHVARGFCWYVQSPPANGLLRSTLDLRLTLGLMPHLPRLRDYTETTALQRGVSFQILRLTATHWDRTLADFNTNWIELEFRQLMSFNQMDAIDLATKFLDRGQYLADKTERAHTMNVDDKIPADVMHRLQDSLSSLEQALLTKDPMMSNHLRNTHALLISYPETVHLLDDSEIARIIDAAEIHTKTEIVKAVASGKGGSSRAKISAGDL